MSAMLSGPIVFAILDGDCRLRVGTWSEGIKTVNPSSGIFAHLESGATRGTISVLAIDSMGHVWTDLVE